LSIPFSIVSGACCVFPIPFRVLNYHSLNYYVCFASHWILNKRGKKNFSEYKPPFQTIPNSPERLKPSFQTVHEHVSSLMLCPTNMNGASSTINKLLRNIMNTNAQQEGVLGGPKMMSNREQATNSDETRVPTSQSPPKEPARNLSDSEYRSNISHHCRRGELDLAMQNLESLHHIGSVDIRSLELIANLSMRKVDANSNRRIFRMLLESSEKGSVVLFTDLITTFARNFDMTEMLDAAIEMRKRGMKAPIVVWHAMITAYAMKENSEVTIQLYFEMEKEGIHPTAAIFETIIQGLATTGNLEKMVEFWSRMVEFQYTPSRLTLWTILSGLWRHLGKEATVSFFRGLKTLNREELSLMDKSMLQSLETIQSEWKDFLNTENNNSSNTGSNTRHNSTSGSDLKNSSRNDQSSPITITEPSISRSQFQKQQQQTLSSQTLPSSNNGKSHHPEQQLRSVSQSRYSSKKVQR